MYICMYVDKLLWWWLDDNNDDDDADGDGDDDDDDDDDDDEDKDADSIMNMICEKRITAQLVRLQPSWRDWERKRRNFWRSVVAKSRDAALQNSCLVDFHGCV